ncbi:LuxR family transcriptional regulator [Pseudoalteromonas tunicata]|nr:LuxR family transcriptional regulator [Pseudoalteromonas tunicata]
MYDAFKRCKKKSNKTVNFTKREIECLKWATEGKTSWEISKILTITDRTVNYHIANCIRKTNSSNRQQAIAKFYAMGIL